jgi:CubicO group peptidase (beta-lactamase class C family)
MGPTPYDDDALDRIGRAVARHVDAGAAPGAVWAVARGDQVHLDAVGRASVDGTDALPTDALFRISSMTKPVTAVAALSCIEDGLFRLDEPVDGLLPELAGRTVLEHEDAPLGWVVPARRPILVRDLLTFTMGLGIVMAPPGEIPLADALVELELGQGPPQPQVPPAPDEWIRRLGTLPLLHHPGERWIYGTGSDVLGVLMARATGLPFPEVLRRRVFDPLGMADTGFSVAPDDLHRLVPGYGTDPATGALEEYDPPAGAWSRPPAFPSGAAGLASTAADMLEFGRMLLAGGLGPDGGRVISRAAVAAMTTDQLMPAQKEGGLVDSTFRGRGWGFGVSVVTSRTDIAGSVGSYGWDGGLGTCWMNDPAEQLVTLLFTQAAWSSPDLPAIGADFRTAAWAGLAV